MKSFNLDTTVTVCGGTPQEPINVSNSNDTYVVDTLVDLELPDITVTDSDGTVATVPSMENVVCTPQIPQTPVRVSNSDDTYDVNTLVDLELPDSSVSNSNNSYVNALPATEDLALPNINVTDSDGTITSVPSMEDITCTPQIPPTPVRVSNINDSYDVNTLVDLELPNINFTDSDGVTTSVPSMEDVVATSCPVKSGIVYERFYHNNSKLSVALYDEAWLISNGVLDAYTIPANPLYTQKLDPTDNTGNTLLHLNAFGNYIRFTYADGTQSSMSGTTYSIDNLTGLGIAGFATAGSYNSYFGSNGLIAQTNTANTGGHNDWFGATSAIFWRMSEQDPATGGSLYCKRDLNWNTSTLLSNYTTLILYFNGTARLLHTGLTTVKHFLTVRIHFKGVVPTAAEVLADGNTVLWVDSEENVTKNGANKVSVWGDKSGEGNDLLQATGASQPLYSTNGILFDGVNDFMKALPFTLVQPEMIYIVFKQITWTLNDRMFDGEASPSMLISQYATSPALNMYGGSSLSNANLALNTFGIARCLYDGANSKFIINDTIPVTGDVGTLSADGFTLAKKPNSTQFYSNIEVKEIIIRKVADSATDEALIYQYLSDKYGI